MSTGTDLTPPDDGTDRLWTIPNGLSVLRLLGVPLFLYLLLGPHADGWALGIPMISGFTDRAPAANAVKLRFTGGNSVPPIAPMTPDFVMFAARTPARYDASSNAN